MPGPLSLGSLTATTAAPLAFGSVNWAGRPAPQAHCLQQ